MNISVVYIFCVTICENGWLACENEGDTVCHVACCCVLLRVEAALRLR